MTDLSDGRRWILNMTGWFKTKTIWLGQEAGG